MSFTDLDGVISSSDLSAATSNAPGASYYAGKVLDNRRLRQDRELIAEYIDILAVEHTRGETHPSDTRLTRNFRVNACLLDRIDVASMDAAWALAAEEVVTAAIAGVASKLGMHSPFYKTATASPKLVEVHQHLHGYLNTLDGVTGSKTKLAEMMDLTDALINEILEEKRD